MKKFNFSLASVHSVRELREEKEQTVYARLQQDAANVEKRLETLKQKRSEALVNYLKVMRGGTKMDPSEMDLHSKHIASLERQKIETEIELEEKKSACRMQAGHLTAAAREVKVTEKLREKQKAVHDQELAKYEQTALDEITSAKYARKTGQTN